MNMSTDPFFALKHNSGFDIMGIGRTNLDPLRDIISPITPNIKDLIDLSDKYIKNPYDHVMTTGHQTRGLFDPVQSLIEGTIAIPKGIIDNLTHFLDNTGDVDESIDRILKRGEKISNSLTGQAGKNFQNIFGKGGLLGIFPNLFQQVSSTITQNPLVAGLGLSVSAVGILLSIALIIGGVAFARIVFAIL
jgi:hypothetical protein